MALLQTWDASSAKFRKQKVSKLQCHTSNNTKFLLSYNNNAHYDNLHMEVWLEASSLHRKMGAATPLTRACAELDLISLIRTKDVPTLRFLWSSPFLSI